MARLTRADMEAALACAAEVGNAAPHHERADGWILERIAGLIGLEIASYAQLETSSSRILSDVEYPANPTEGQPWTPTQHELQIWLTQNPFCTYAHRTGDRYFSAIRLSDVVDMRAFAQTEFFEMLDSDMPQSIQMRTPGTAGTHWTLDLGRSGRNFSMRDRLLLDALRPPLIAYESLRALTRMVEALKAARPDSMPDDVLSARDNEVLDLVAEGASNAEIAERLWISPATVKKHLENVYEKLAVGSRTAALARSGRSLAASDTIRADPGIRSGPKLNQPGPK